MKLHKTSIAGALVIELEPLSDARGVFAEAFVSKKLSALGLEFDPQRVHLVKSDFAGTVRGMHFQKAPWAQGKIVMAASGRIFDAIVDVRPDSETRGISFSLELKPLWNALFIPRGVAHGCQALMDGSTLIYLVDNEYMPSHEDGVRPDDPAINIKWPLPMVNVSKRDLSWPAFHKMG